MRPVQNEHVDQLDEVRNEELKMISVSQVISARDSIFSERLFAIFLILLVYRY